MTTTLFVSETYIRDNTPFNQNLDVKDILNNIAPAQEMNLEPILGSNFYEELQSSYSAQTLTADETTLVAHIKPFVTYAAAELSIPYLVYQIKNKGPQTQSGDFSQPVDGGAMKYLINDLKNRKEWYGQRLVKYLCDNSTLFSGYTVDNSDDLSPSSKIYDSGFALYNNSCNSSFFAKYGYWPNSF